VAGDLRKTPELLFPLTSRFTCLGEAIVFSNTTSYANPLACPTAPAAGLIALTVHLE
jgi:hypothetical protein